MADSSSSSSSSSFHLKSQISNLKSPRHLLTIGLILALFAWLFADALFAANLFVYRDAAHFYYPLFEEVEREWNAGRVPLWNPYENCGTPLLANPTASVLYPGKLVFRLPIGFDTAFKTYILMHVLLAALTTYRLARRWGAPVEGAGLAALAYAFSGNVMFQYCNVVFLVSAAWLPVALLLAARMLENRSPLAAAGLGAVLALMTLGGDPQMAYQAGLLAALYALLLWRNERLQPRTPIPRVRNRLALLAQAALWAGALGAVQVLPTQEFGAESVRGHSELPRSLYQIPGYIARTSGADPAEQMPRIDTRQPPHWYDALVGDPPPPAAHAGLIYQFSVGPWRLVEFLWPNIAGKQFPTNRRWLGVLPAEAAIWVPSFYLGLLPVLLALASWRLREGDVRVRWLRWMLLLAVLASFGQYGLGWLLRVTTGAKPIGDEVGGLYWLMTVLLPGYADFRFPGKLLVVASLAISLLAARGWSELAAGERLARWAARLGIATAAIFSLVVIAGLLSAAITPVSAWFQSLAGNVDADAYFGPFDPAGAWWDVTFGLAQTLVMCAALWWLLAKCRDERRWPALLVLTALDIGLANRWMVATAPAELWHTQPKLAAVIEQAERDRGVDPAAFPPRVFRLPSWQPDSFGERISPARQAEGLVWDRDTLHPKYNLRDRISLVQTAGTLELYDFEMFWQPSVRQSAQDSSKNEIVQPRRAIDAWGARYLILPKKSYDDDNSLSLVGLREAWLEPRWSQDRPQGAPGGERLPAAVSPAELKKLEASELEDVEVFYNPSHYPRTWIVHDMAALPPMSRHEKRRLQGVMQAVLFPFQHWIDLSQMALIEDETMVMFVAEQMGRTDGQIRFPTEPGESSRILSEDPQRVEIEAVLKQPGLVVLSDVYYPGWTLEIETLEGAQAGSPRPMPFFKTNRIMRGAFLYPGKHRLVYRFQPSSVYWGATISGLAWLALAAMGGYGLWRKGWPSLAGSGSPA